MRWPLTSRLSRRASTASLAPWTMFTTPLGNPALSISPKQKDMLSGTLLGGLEDVGVAAGDGIGEETSGKPWRGN